jgi:flagellar biogenesis protein FliO
MLVNQLAPWLAAITFQFGSVLGAVAVALLLVYLVRRFRGTSR